LYRPCGDYWTNRPKLSRRGVARRLDSAAVCWTAAQMATALGVPAERYRKYEYRSPLPHYLIERFALIVGRDVEYVLTGNRVARSLPMEERRKIA
jgi:hypothetical protein